MSKERYEMIHLIRQRNTLEQFIEEVIHDLPLPWQSEYIRFLHEAKTFLQQEIYIRAQEEET